MSEDRKLGCVTVLAGERDGRYPHGNSLLVEGGEERLMIDPSLDLAGRVDRPRVDRVLNSHCHEDHVAGTYLFPGVPHHVPRSELAAALTLDGIMALYGYSKAADDAFRPVVLETFNFTPRPFAQPYDDGAVFELGGGVRVRAIHAPGHTHGHTLFHIEPADVLYLGDIDLTKFGPYYGDAASSLEDFERTLARVRLLDARYYATFHQEGVVEGKAAFLELLDRFCGVIATREARLLEFLREPHTMAEIIAHRFVYRPKVEIPFADDVERRSMSQHLDRLLAQGRVREVEPEKWVASAGPSAA